MTKIKIGINGFGRIGRLVARIAAKHNDIELVAVNDLVSPDNLAYLFAHDTVHGRYQGEVSHDESSLIIDGRKIQILSEKDPASLPWGKLGVEYVIEATGRFTKKEDAEKHVAAGAKRVIISAPAKGDVSIYVMGVNHTNYDPAKDIVLCNASCTTNCLAPVTKVLLDHFGIEEGLMTTIHAVTATQPTVDGPSQRDFRAGRAAGYNIIPASTGAAKAVAKCIPEIEGKLTGMAFRIPTVDVSAVDLTVKLGKDTSYEEISAVMKDAAENTMKGILKYSEEHLVSSDIIGDSHSAIFDQKAGIALNPRFYKLISWYDNEWGYSARIIDLVLYMADREP